MIFSGSAPMQPVTMTLPFSVSASPMASSDSALALIEEAAGVDDDQVRARMARARARSPRRAAA